MSGKRICPHSSGVPTPAVIYVQPQSCTPLVYIYSAQPEQIDASSALTLGKLSSTMTTVCQITTATSSVRHISNVCLNGSTYVLLSFFLSFFLSFSFVVSHAPFACQRWGRPRMYFLHSTSRQVLSVSCLVSHLVFQLQPCRKPVTLAFVFGLDLALVRAKTLNYEHLALALTLKLCYLSTSLQARSSTVAEKPRDASRHWIVRYTHSRSLKVIRKLKVIRNDTLE